MTPNAPSPEARPQGLRVGRAHLRSQLGECALSLVSKLVAGREKDFEFARASLAANLIDTRTLRDRAEQLDGVPAARRRVIEWIARTGT